MSSDLASLTPEGPFEGSRCLAGPDERWGPATIRRVNEDGSFKVELDFKWWPFDYWYGVTSAEISFNDTRQWAHVFAQISPDGKSFDRTNFQYALASLGHHVSGDQVQQLWATGCRTLFNVPEVKAETYILDEAMSYRLFLPVVGSAKKFAERLKPDGQTPYFKLYWNQVRMGGRDPSEIRRVVTLEDALAALGLTASAVDESAVAFLRRFEQEQAVRLPTTLVNMLQRVGIASAIYNCHSNAPSLVEFKQGGWALLRGMRQRQLNGDYALVIMVPHQGDHEWAVVFDDGEDDARVYVRWNLDDGETWHLSAPGIGMFFWDLAQTGFSWYQDTKYKGGKLVEHSDIGLILKS